MLSEPLSQGDGLFHRMDARIKLLTIGPALVAVSILQNPRAASAALLFALVLTLVAGIRLGTAMRRLIPANLFFISLGLVLGLTYPGPALANIGWISHDGLNLALRIALKGNTLLLLFIVLAGTTTVPALSRGLQALGLPRKLTLLLAFTHRQIFLVADEFQRLHRAALARGFHAGCNMHTYKSFAVLFGQTLLRSLARAERIHGAMHLRGFTGKFHSLQPPALAWRKTFPAAVFCLLPVLICLVDRWPQ